MDDRRRLVLRIALGVAVALVAAAVVFVMWGRDESPAPARDAPGEDEDRAGWDDEDDDWFGPAQEQARESEQEQEPRRERRERRWGSEPDGRMGPPWGPPGMRGDREGRRERRRERREARRQRFLERVHVAPLGPGEGNPTPESVHELFRGMRRGVRQCMRDGDVGFGVWREARSVEREISFRIGPDGQIAADSLVVDPALPDALDACFQAAAQGVTTEPSPDGAEVSVPMPARRRRRDRDAGVEG